MAKFNRVHCSRNPRSRSPTPVPVAAGPSRLRDHTRSPNPEQHNPEPRQHHPALAGPVPQEIEGEPEVAAAAPPESLSLLTDNPHLGRLRVTPARVKHHAAHTDLPSRARAASLDRVRQGYAVSVSFWTARSERAHAHYRALVRRAWSAHSARITQQRIAHVNRHVRFPGVWGWPRTRSACEAERETHRWWTALSDAGRTAVSAAISARAEWIIAEGERAQWAKYCKTSLEKEERKIGRQSARRRFERVRTKMHAVGAFGAWKLKKLLQPPARKSVPRVLSSRGNRRRRFTGRL